MSAPSIEKEFQDKVSTKVRLISEGVDRFRVFTPFLFEDGDHLSIVLKRQNSEWILSDEAHTFMHLTYDIEEADLQRGTRQQIITNALSVFGVEDTDGELTLQVPDERYGDALYGFVQALLKITSVTNLSRERVRSTFVEDFKSLFTEWVPDRRRKFDWHDPSLDPSGNYRVDCRINGMSKPMYVHALSNDSQTRDATIALHQFENWGLQFNSLAIFDDQESINRKVLARFSDVCDKQFSNLGNNHDRIQRFIEDALVSRN